MKEPTLHLRRKYSFTRSLVQTLSSSFGGGRECLYLQPLANAASHLAISATVHTAARIPASLPSAASHLPPPGGQSSPQPLLSAKRRTERGGEEREGRSEAQGGVLRGLLLLRPSPPRTSGLPHSHLLLPGHRSAADHDGHRS